MEVDDDDRVPLFGLQTGLQGAAANGGRCNCCRRVNDIGGEIGVLVGCRADNGGEQDDGRGADRTSRRWFASRMLGAGDTESGKSEAGGEASADKRRGLFPPGSASTHNGARTLSQPVPMYFRQSRARRGVGG